MSCRTIGHRQDRFQRGPHGLEPAIVQIIEALAGQSRNPPPSGNKAPFALSTTSRLCRRSNRSRRPAIPRRFSLSHPSTQSKEIYPSLLGNRRGPCRPEHPIKKAEIGANCNELNCSEPASEPLNASTRSHRGADHKTELTRLPSWRAISSAFDFNSNAVLAIRHLFQGDGTRGNPP